MTPGARVAAAIELLDAVIDSAREGGASADMLADRYFRARRYMGSGDRRAVRELAFAAIRRFGERPLSGRSAMVAMADVDPELAALFDGQGHAPSPVLPGEPRAGGGELPRWIATELVPELGPGEAAALLERAPLDLRLNLARVDPAGFQARWPEAIRSPVLKAAFRLPGGTRIESDPDWLAGAIEVQDWGSQAIVASCIDLQAGALVVDLCAGAGGKTLALAARFPEARIIACDISRARLDQLRKRAERAGIAPEIRLLDPRREAERLGDLSASADLVLVDAPCSGSGTWRRNPETRWRLDSRRLAQLVAEQGRLAMLALSLLRPGGELCLATCSVLEREGPARHGALAEAVNDLLPRETGLAMGRRPQRNGSSAGVLLTPSHDGTDGFHFTSFQRL